MARQVTRLIGIESIATVVDPGIEVQEVIALEAGRILVPDEGTVQGPDQGGGIGRGHQEGRALDHITEVGHTQGRGLGQGQSRGQGHTRITIKKDETQVAISVYRRAQNDRDLRHHQDRGRDHGLDRAISVKNSAATICRLKHVAEDMTAFFVSTACRVRTDNTLLRRRDVLHKNRKEQPKLTPQERLKLRMQKQLSKQIKQDKQVERKKKDDKEKERMDRDNDIYELQRKIRYRPRNDYHHPRERTPSPKASSYGR
eukprot:gene13316-4160_t